MPDRRSCSRSTPSTAPRRLGASTTGSSARRRRSTPGRRGYRRAGGAVPRADRRARRGAARRRARGEDPWSAFATVPEQPEAKRLLGAALAEGPAHAYLLHGPRGVGRRTAARAFASALLGDDPRAARERPTHPDLYLLEPLGEMIRIDDIRELRHDLHMRPFEADRRVYLLLDAHLLNEDAADALLKDLEEPPEYATHRPRRRRARAAAGDDPLALPARPLPPAIDAAVRDWLAEHAPELRTTTRAMLARVAAGRLDRARRLLDPRRSRAAQRARRGARSVVPRRRFDPIAAAASSSTRATRARGEAARASRTRSSTLELTGRDAEQRVRSARAGAEREELLASLEALAAWYRDLVVVAAGAERPSSMPTGSPSSARTPPAGGRCRGGGAAAPGLARGGGVQRQRVARARGALRPRPPGLRLIGPAPSSWGSPTPGSGDDKGIAVALGITPPR